MRPVKTSYQLREELERLKRKLQMAYELKVIWIPNGNDKLSERLREKLFLFMKKAKRRP